MLDQRHTLAHLVVAASLALGSGCDGKTMERGDPARSAPGETASTETFWAPFEGADLDWVESKPTLAALAASADLVVLARVERVTLGTAIQGDAEEDVYLEADLQLAPTEVVRGMGPTNPVLTLMLTSPSRAEAEASVARIDQLGLQRPSLFLLRHRQDSGKYRVVNGHGIWVEEGAELTTPLAETEQDRARYESEVSQHASLSSLASYLR